jgi:hypothetical protein
MPTENKTPVIQQPKRSGTSIAVNVIVLVIAICVSFATGIIVANALHDKPGEARNARQGTQKQIPNNNQRRQNRQKPTAPEQKEEKDSEEQKES